jgi:hypothetical protein
LDSQSVPHLLSLSRGIGKEKRKRKVLRISIVSVLDFIGDSFYFVVCLVHVDGAKLFEI